MKKRLFKPIKIGGATAIITIASFLSYGIGLLRDRIIAINFGTTSATDTYNASFLVPDILFNLFIAGALSAAFLPVFSDLLVKDKKEAYKLANTVLTGATVLIAALAIIAYIFMKQIVPFIFEEATISMQTDIIQMTRLLLFSAILFAISNTLGNILMSFKHFLSYALSPILYNLGIIVGVIYFNESLGIYSAAAGVLIGALLHCLIRVIDTATTDYKYKPSLNLKHPGLKKIIKLMIPRSIGLIAWQINLLIFAKVGIKLVEGGFAAFNFARNIQSFAVSLFGISFATAVFPFLSNTVSNNDREGYTDHIQKTMQRILFFTIPAAVGVMTLSTELIEMILGGGAFNEKSIQLTSLLLYFFAFSIPFESLSQILSRAFYAIHNTITPMIVNIISMLIISFCTIFLAPRFGIEWFSIGFGLGFIVYVTIIIILLKKHLKSFKTKVFIKSLSKTIIASAVMAIFIISSTFLPHLIRIVLATSIFFITAAILKSSEIGSIKYILDRIFKKSNL